MAKKANPDRVPLTIAALKIGLSPERLRRRVAAHEIAGGVDDRGRWYVERKAVDRAVREQAEATSAA